MKVGWPRPRPANDWSRQFEDWTDTGEEYELLDELGRDRGGATEAAAA